MNRLSKIFLPVFIALSMLIATVPAFADATAKTADQKATDLHNMGLYAGTDTNTFSPDSGSSLTRAQGATLLIRLMGLESEALALSNSDVSSVLSGFSDAANIPDWAEKYVACGVKKGLIKGCSGGTFEPESNMTYAQYATIALRALGYSDDFSQAAETFAAKAGLAGGTSPSGTAPLKRSDAVDMSFGTLNLPVCSGAPVLLSTTGFTSAYNWASGYITLGQVLIENGTVDRQVAINAGITPAQPLPIYIPDVPAVADVTFSALSAIPSDTGTTTQLKLEFSSDPATLSIDNITVSGATKADLTGSGKERTLTITNITVANGAPITVSISNPSGYNILQAEKTVAVTVA